MRRRRAFLGLCTAGAVAAASAFAIPGLTDVVSSHAAGTPIYQDTTYTFGERAADLVSRMTLTQKAMETDSSLAHAIPSLGVSAYGWWNEALHGVNAQSTATTDTTNANTLTNTTEYPVDQSMGSSWDPTMVWNVANAIADEAREVAPNNTQDLDFYSPTINLERDPRWGRTDESWGEDPYLVSKLVEQSVEARQGEGEDGNLLPSADGYYRTISTLKHYTANNSEVNRLNGNSAMDVRTLEEYYTYDFRNIVEVAHPGSIMSSYNEVNGTPDPANAFLLQTLLRQTFGFTGYVTSDCDAVYEITAGHNWQPTGWSRPVNVLEREAEAMSAGNDLDCNAGYHDTNYNETALPTDATAGIVTPVDTFNVNDLDVSATRLFTTRFELGEFDNPANVPWVQAARTELNGVTWTSSNSNGAITETPARLALARSSADESLVLLKNTPTTTTLALASAAGASNINVAGVANLNVGDTLRIDSGANQESAAIKAIGTGAVTPTTLALASTAGATNIKVASVAGLTVGDPLTVDRGATNQETATLQAIGTAAVTPTTTLALASTAGATNIKVASVTGLTVGDPLTIDTGANQETVTLQTIGTAAVSTTLSVAANIGATGIRVASTANLAVGEQLTIDRGATNQETLTISTIPSPAPASPAANVTLTGQLGFAHASGASVVYGGTGLTVTALQSAHAVSAAVADFGTGLTVTALQSAHAVGAAVADFGTGVTLTGNLQFAHAAATAVVDTSNGNILPLKVPASGTYKVAVVGGLAQTIYLGGYSSSQGTAGATNEVNNYAGIKAAIQAIDPSAQVDFIRGFTGTSTSASGLTTVDTTNPPGTDANSIYNLQANGPYNAVIVDVGTDGTTAMEASDRANISLPGAQNALIADVSALNPNTIVYQETVGPNDITGFDDPTPYDPTDTQVAADPPAELWSSYNGERTGQAIGDVLVGNYNPSGHLPSTWYHDVNDLPPITDYDIRPNGPNGSTNLPGGENGRTYMYYNGPISYPFGYGLSYTTYGASNLQINGQSTSLGSPLAVGASNTNTINVSVNVTNTGSTNGNDVVELYVNQPGVNPALQRPIKRLEGSDFVYLAAGQTQTVTLPIQVSNLAYFNQTDNRWEIDDGLYGIQISSSAADQDIQQEGYINVSGALTPTVNVVTAQPTMPGDAARGIIQRVMFPIGTTINPGLTVSMSDDTLYGTIGQGQSKPLPAGMTFSYSSDRPSTVSVAPDGTITTLANGAATITATATYQGVSKSTSFVVRVLSELNGITVNGNPLTAFLPDNYNYDITLPPGAAVPTVAATDPDSGATVAVTQAPGVPGTATITDTGPDGVVLTYTVNFAYGAVSDNFASSTLGSQWTIVRPDPTHYSLTLNPGSLTLTPEKGTLATTTNTATNLFVQPALGNWTVTTKETWSALPALAGQQAGLIAYQNDDDYLEFGLLDGAPDELAVTHEDNLDDGGGSETSPNNVVLTTLATSTVPALNGNKVIWLRMSKSGPSYTESYSTDGVNYTPLYTSGESLTNVKVGVYAFNGTSSTVTTNTVSFSPFLTTNATTTASLSPAPVDGYYNVDPTVTLSATDPGGPGILNTSYQVDGGATNIYNGQFKITGDGQHTLQYWSTDDNGAIEATNTLTVKVDTTPPVTTAVINGVTVPANSSSFTATAPAITTLSAVDPLVGSPTPVASGVNQTFYSISGGATNLYTGAFPIAPLNGNTSNGGNITLKYWSTDNAGNVEDPTIVVLVEPAVPVSVTSNVPSALSVSVGNTAPNFGAFTPGQAGTYTSTVGATITTTAASSTLTAADTCSPAATCFPGYLVNSTAVGGPYRLASGLQVDATSSNPSASGSNVYTDLSVTNPAPLLSYSMPVSNDPVTIGFKQNIGANDPLRTGTYTKTITITLSTTTP